MHRFIHSLYAYSWSIYLLNLVLLDIINKYEILWRHVFIFLAYASRTSIVIDYSLLLSIIIEGTEAVIKQSSHKCK